MIIEAGERSTLIGLHKLMQAENGGFVVELHQIVEDERERRAALSNVLPLPQKRQFAGQGGMQSNVEAAGRVIAFVRSFRQSART
ncbi:hypothetical protein ACU5AY_03710 [Rhizobium sp. PAMB 3174]